MKSIGFIGLGIMGAGMAANLLKKGYAVTVYNRTASKADELKLLGADVAPSPAEAVRTVDVLITMISDEAALQDVYYGEGGVINGVKPGTVVFDCSTVSPAMSRRLHEDLAAHFVEFLDAPVTGSKPAAIDGKLVFMVGGSQETMEEHSDILLAMGASYRHMGPAGAGSQAKLAMNTIVGINMAGLVEGMALAAKSGVDLESFLEIVLSGGASSRMAEMKSKKLLDRDYSTQFSLKLMLKDLQLAWRQSASLQLPTPMLSSAESLYRIGLAKGLGEQDLSAIVQCYEDWGNQKLSRPSKAKAKISDDNRRKDIRVPLGIKLQISIYQWEKEGAFSGQSIEASLSNLSESGMQIVCDIPLAVEMFVVIHFPQEAELPPITGKIIRIEQSGNSFSYGCLISGMAPYTRLKLEAYIQNHVESMKI